MRVADFGLARAVDADDSHQAARGRRHAALHGPRAVGRPRRRPQRPLRPGPDALRDADPAPGLRRPGLPSPRRRPRAAEDRQPGGAAGPGGDRAQVHRPRSRRALPGRRPAQGGPGAFPPGQAGPGTPRFAGRAGLALVPPQPRPGGHVLAGGGPGRGRRGRGAGRLRRDPQGVCRDPGAYAETKTALARAEATSQLALDVLDGIYVQLSPDRAHLPSDAAPGGRACACVGLRSGDDAPAPPKPAQVPASQETAALLGELLGFYDRLAEQTGSDPRVMLQSAVAGRRVGDIRQRLGQVDRAEGEYTRAAERLEALLAPGAGPAVYTELARCYNEIGNVHATRLDLEGALDAHRKALAVLQSVDGSGGLPEPYWYERARTWYFMSSKTAAASGAGQPPRAAGGRAPRAARGRRPRLPQAGRGHPGEAGAGEPGHARLPVPAGPLLPPARGRPRSGRRAGRRRAPAGDPHPREAHRGVSRPWPITATS